MTLALPTAVQPSAESLIAVQQVENGILRLGLGVEAGRRVHVEVALVADDLRLEEVMMDDAVRYFGDIPQLGRRARDLDNVLRLNEIGLDGGVVGVEQEDAIGDECVAVEVGIERAEREAPEAGVIACHRRGLRRTFEVELYIFCARIEQDER